jgi:alpha-1,6-mannosyltransferase
MTLWLTTPPTLSDDVYRYIWDGRLMNAGVNPYAHPVDSPALDALNTGFRQLVNHPEMSTPYLPAAQIFSATVYRIAPENPLAFQVATSLLDLLTGLLVIDLLRHLELPASRALIYLWHPLVVVEFAHGAHVDAVMTLLVMAALWLVIVARRHTLSAVALAAATLIKGLPLLLLPVMARRWGLRGVVIYLALLATAFATFAREAGWGLIGPLDGTGVFGTVRIYADRWNYNGGIFHRLETAICAYPMPGAVPSDIGTWTTIFCTKIAPAALLALALVVVWKHARHHTDDLTLLRLAAVPLAVYLLLTTTVHPWYATMIVPLLPFFVPGREEASRIGPFLLPALYLSTVVALSYLTYVDPARSREYDAVWLVEYVPLYLMLLWATVTRRTIRRPPATAC